MALAQEPWCFSPDQIAMLTDFQVIELYLNPAIEQSKKTKSMMDGKSDVDLSDVEDPFIDGLPDREEFVATFMASEGGSREHWLKQYEILVQSFDANKVSSNGRHA